MGSPSRSKVFQRREFEFKTNHPGGKGTGILTFILQRLVFARITEMA